MRVNQVRTFPFSDAAVCQLLSSSGTSVKYLHSYLVALDAKSILVEAHYVDRHYLDDFSHYYSKSFSAPPASCARLHFFGGLNAVELDALIGSAYLDKSARAEAESVLQEKYLGFVVKRPLSAATMGRTVLKTYPVEGRRHYNVVRPYLVNIGGLRLTIDGLAYQQQDRGAAVCASTALWSALQRVAYVDGNRTPTPSAITRAARSPYPASMGLGLDQMASALDSLGYVAEALAPVDNRSLFRAEIVSYLQSHLPVILLVYAKKPTGAGGEVKVGHAVTVTGFSETGNIVEVPSHRHGAPKIKMKSGALDIIYVHDDNLGSHAHYELFDSDEVNEHGYKKLMLHRGRSNSLPVDWWPTDDWEVAMALVPKPHKLRMPISSLFEALLWVKLALETKIFPGVDLHFDVRFESGVGYRRNVFDLTVDSTQLRDFQATAALPRHVGIISAFTGNTHLCDMVVDVSEIDRNPQRPSMLAVVAPGVPLMSPAHVNLLQFQAVLSCPLITGPATPAIPPEVPSLPAIAEPTV